MRDLQICDASNNQNSTAPDQSSRSHCETSATYENVIAAAGEHRIAICKQNMQWLFQRRRPRKQGAGERWDNIGYCITRLGLMRLQRAENADLQRVIESMPEKFTATKL